MSKLFLNEEQKEYLKTILDKPHYDVTDLFYKKYKITLNRSQVKHYREKLKVPCSVKGLGQFKKGNIPHNKQKIGYEFTSTDGYTYVKVAEPKVYVKKQRYIWEQHYGKIPKDCCVVFLDQDKTNFDINNLMLVRIKDLCMAKNLKLISKNKELTKTGLLLGKLVNRNFEERTKKGSNI